MTCPNCKSETDSVKAGIVGGVYIDSYCEHCLSTLKHAGLGYGKYLRDRDREDYRRDIIQPWEGDKPSTEFIKEYPEKAHKIFTPEQIEKYGG